MTRRVKGGSNSTFQPSLAQQATVLVGPRLASPAAIASVACLRQCDAPKSQRASFECPEATRGKPALGL